MEPILISRSQASGGGFDRLPLCIASFSYSLRRGTTVHFSNQPYYGAY